MEKKASIDTYEYKAEMKQLLHLIIHSLYTHPEVFLRELISNASDALNKIRLKKLTNESLAASDEDLQIKINVEDKKKRFSIEDNGVGMTKKELITNIGTVARSGTLEFLENLKQAGKTSPENLIGQFGVGFYSVFMVTDEVVIETKSADPSLPGYRWTSSGEGSFTVEEIEKETCGTKISFTFKESAHEFSKEYTIKNIITKYSNFADFPIMLNNERANAVEALWRKKTQDITEGELNEFYKFITNDYDSPLTHLHLSIEGAAVNFKALLFIPQKAPFDFVRFRDEKAVSLYANKILIQGDCKDIVPEYLRFFKGVVDTIDLPLNVSREVTQASPLFAKIKNIITSKALSFLKEWAEKEPDAYKTFYKQFGVLLKTGVNTDFTNRDKIIELLRFESSTSEKDSLVSFKEYASRMQKDQKEIYYLTGEHRDIIEKNPNLEYFKKNQIEVLLLTDPADIFMIPSITEYDKKKVVAIDQADITLDKAGKIEKPEDTLSQSLLSLFKATLKGKVENVVASKRLVDSPVTLVVGKDGMNAQMEKMMKMMNRGAAVPSSQKVMEVNLEHPVVRNLSKIYLADAASPLLQKCITQLYESALLLEGSLENPSDFITRMNDIMQKATQ